MDAIVQIQPHGFLGLFQLKNVGQSPSPMEAGLKPVVDLTEWYLQTNSRSIFQQRPLVEIGLYNGAFVGFVDPVVVPDDEWWYVNGYDISAGFSATQWVDITPAYRLGVTGNAVHTGPTARSGMDWNAGVPKYLQWGVSSPWWLPPGTELGMVHNFYNDGTILEVTLYGALRATRMKV